eukprot:symbB.v1.2.030850.t1/scaffold3518.1/size54960/1
MRCTTCMDSSAMLLSVARLEVTIFVLGAGAVGLSILVRSFTRLELSLLILNFAQLDLALFARHLVRVDGDLTVGGALRFSETTYLDSSSGNLEAYVSSTRTLSLSSEGGTLHGLWSADTVVSLSDRRLKRNIRPLQKALPKGPDSEITPVRWVLRQLRPVSYRFVRGDFWGVDAKHIRFGFIADEIQQVLPEVVREVNVAEGPRKSIVYTDLIAILTAAVRDFGSEVEAVKKRVALAEAALNDLDEKEPMT